MKVFLLISTLVMAVSSIAICLYMIAIVVAMPFAGIGLMCSSAALGALIALVARETA